MLVSAETFKKFQLFETKSLKDLFGLEDELVFATSTSFQNYDYFFKISNPKLIRNYQKLIYTTNSNFRKFNYVIIDQNFRNFNQTIHNLLSENNLQVHGKYYVKIFKNLTKSEIEEFFGTLWKHEIYNIVLESNNNLYTWYPYRNCGKITAYHTNITQGFINKIPRKLNCSLRVDWTPTSITIKNASNKTDPGIFIWYTNEIARSLGTSFEYLKNELDFTNTSLNFNQEMHDRNVTFTVGPFGYFFDGLTGLSAYVAPMESLLVLPPRKAVSKWRVFFKFDNTTIFLTVLTVSGCCCLLQLFAR